MQVCRKDFATKMYKFLAEFEEAVNAAPEKVFEVEYKIHREKRSLNANAYMWVLLEKLAEQLHTDKDNLYRIMLLRYAPFTTISVVKDAAEAFVASMESPCKIVGESSTNGKDFVHIRVCKTSSKFDTKEMSRLLDGVIIDCKDLGIETKTPVELALLDGYEK